MTATELLHHKFDWEREVPVPNPTNIVSAVDAKNQGNTFHSVLDPNYVLPWKRKAVES